MSEQFKDTFPAEDSTTYWISQIASSMSQPLAGGEGALAQVQPEHPHMDSNVTYGNTVSMRVNCIRIPGFEDDIVPTRVGFSLSQSGEVPIEAQAIQAMHEHYKGELAELQERHRLAHPSQAAYPDMFAYEKAVKEREQELFQLQDRVACYTSLLAAINAAQVANESAVTFGDTMASDAYHAIIEGMGMLAYRNPDTYDADALADAVQFHDDR